MNDATAPTPFTPANSLSFDELRCWPHTVPETLLVLPISFAGGDWPESELELRTSSEASAHEEDADCAFAAACAFSASAFSAASLSATCLFSSSDAFSVAISASQPAFALAASEAHWLAVARPLATSAWLSGLRAPLGAPLTICWL